jgi:phosphoglycerate dehydrogenase-like enzyme
MVNMANLHKLERQPFLINVSRAELIDYEALLFALENQLIKGVAIDAHYEEPTRPDDRLYSFQNVLVSPHVAGSTIDSYFDTIDACVSNIEKSLTDKEPYGLL